MLGGILLGVRPALARMPYIPCVLGPFNAYMMMMNFSILKAWILPLEFCSYVVCVHAGILLFPI